MSRQVNQQPISARLDYDVLHIVDQEVYATGIPRNRIINDAIKLYVAVADARRRHGMFGKLKEFYDHMHAVGLNVSQLP